MGSVGPPPPPPSNTFAVQVAVLGLWGTGGGLVLTDNNNDALPVTANGIFQFPTLIESGGSYSVTVQAQPASPAQTCVVTGGSGSVTNDAVNVSVDCGHSEWAWMGGSTSTNQPGTYGTLGDPAAINTPGSRMSAARWVDKQGTLWLFGGVGLDSVGAFDGQLSDLWTYSNGQWTWIGGSDLAYQAGTYGTKGSASATNWPGARGDARTWTDADGTFWLFGGFGFDSTGTTQGYLNDLWKYSGGQWTWVSGSQTSDQAGLYGTRGKASASNVPGGRYYSSAWLGKDGSFWLYGGAGFDSKGQVGYMTDLWNYSGGEWTWVAGPNVWGQNAAYGTQGTAAASNTPGDRNGEVTWTDSSGNLWMFGGEDSNSGAFLNDVWEFSNGEWTWVSRVFHRAARRVRHARCGRCREYPWGTVLSSCMAGRFRERVGFWRVWSGFHWPNFGLSQRCVEIQRRRVDMDGRARACSTTPCLWDSRDALSQQCAWTPLRGYRMGGFKPEFLAV
jgi:hypothetical protein